MSLYRKIFSQSWKITWHRKYLWFFGLFTVLLVGASAETGIFNKIMGGDGQEVFSPWRAIWNAIIASPGAVSGADKLAASDPFSFFTALFVLFVVALLSAFIAWLAIVSQTALVNNIALEATGKDNDLKIGVLAGIDKFWPVVGFNILNALMVSIVSIIVSIPIAYNGLNIDTGNTQLIYILLFVIFVPIALIFSLIIKFATSYSVIKGKKFWQSIHDGYRLFLNNWIISVEMVISLFIMSFLFAFVIMISLLVLLIPFLLVGFVLYYVTQSLLLVGIIAVLALIFAFVAIVLTGSMFFTFQTAAWTNLFVLLVGQGGTAKIIRLVEKITK